MMIHFYRRSVLLLIIGLTACSLPGVAVDPAVPATPQPETTTELDQGGMQATQATIDAGVNATAASQPAIDPQATIDAAIQATTAAQAPTDGSSPTALSEGEPTPTTSPTTAAPTSDETSATQESGPTAPTADQPVIFVPDEGDAAQQTVNIQLVFDASGSMAEDIGGETKIAAARQAMERVIDQLETDNPNLNVGFRVFGHQGDSSEAGKAVSCQSTELLVPVSGVDTDLLRQQTAAWDPTGWTPISLALQRAGEDLTAGENVRNVIIMVTDGEETCDGDPCAVAQVLAESDAEVRVDVVGFGLTPEVADTLQCISENTGGVYTDAQDGDALTSALTEQITAAVQRSYLRIKAVGPDGQPIGSLQLGTIVDQQNQPAQILNPPLGPRLNPLDDGDQLLELVPGTYQFEIAEAPLSSIDTVRLGGSKVTTYTAVVAEGHETTAVVGLGGLTLVDDGAPEEFIDSLQLQMNVDDIWEPVLGPKPLMGVVPPSFDYDNQVELHPGIYRIVDTKREDAVVVDNITIEPGKQIELSITGPGETGE